MTNGFSFEPTLFVLIFDIVGTFAFALNGALTAARFVRLDIVGIFALGLITAMGGGILRDVLIGDVPPAAFTEWYYVVAAAVGSLIAFFVTRPHRIFDGAVRFLDTVGLSLFCVVGAEKALDYGLEVVPAILLGTITAVGGGTIRDVLSAKVPTILTSESGLYAIPAILGSTVVVGLSTVFDSSNLWNIPFALVGAIVCFLSRVLSDRFGLNAPAARIVPDRNDPPSDAPREPKA